MTSFRVVSQVRHLTGEKRVGHAGTLDPEASGVLPVCLGQGTRVVEFLMDATKTYRAQIRLGRATDTRVLAERWLADNVPPGTKVAAQSYSLPNWSPAAEPDGAYELSVFTPLSAAGQFDRLACDGNRYVLTSSFRADRQRSVGRPGAPTGYERLAAQAQLVATFSPVDGERQAPPFNPDDIGLPYWTVTRYDRPGPTINAYHLSPAACPPGAAGQGSAEAPPFLPWPPSGS